MFIFVHKFKKPYDKRNVICSDETGRTRTATDTPRYNDFQNHKVIPWQGAHYLPDIVLTTVGNKTNSNKAEDTNVHNFMVKQRDWQFFLYLQASATNKQHNNKTHLATFAFP